MGEPWADPVPCLGFGLAVVGRVRGDRRLGPGLRHGEPQFRAVLERPAVDAVHSRCFRQPHHTVGADPAGQFDRQVAQDPGQAGDVVAGIADDHDIRDPGLPLTSGDEPLDDTPQQGGGDRGRLVRRSEPDHVQDRGPRRGARLQHSHERAGPARNALRGRLHTPVGTWQNRHCAEHGASRRNHGGTSTAKTAGPPPNRGNDSPAGTVHSPSTSPSTADRRRTGRGSNPRTSLRVHLDTRATTPSPPATSPHPPHTTPSTHSTTPTHANNSPHQTVTHSENPPRKRDASASAFPPDSIRQPTHPHGLRHDHVHLGRST